MASSGYTPITFVANEQPTTAKWNLIGSNDASFNSGTGLEDSVIKERHIDFTDLHPFSADPGFTALTAAAASATNYGTAKSLDLKIGQALIVSNTIAGQASTSNKFQAGVTISGTAITAPPNYTDTAAANSVGDVRITVVTHLRADQDGTCILQPVYTKQTSSGTLYARMQYTIV